MTTPSWQSVARAQHLIASRNWQWAADRWINDAQLSKAKGNEAHVVFCLEQAAERLGWAAEEQAKADKLKG